MINLFSNIWTKRAVSLVSPLYCAGVCYFAYLSVFYDMVMQNPTSLCVLLSSISMIALILMLYTREQLLTKIVSLIMLPAMVLPVLLFFGAWQALIPPLVVALIMFFFSGLSETSKTIFGTIFLLLYLLGSLLYFVTTSLFAPSTVKSVVDSGVSPSGAYRYEVINTVDSSNGSTEISVEPNTMDKDYNLATFQIKGLSRPAYMQRPLQEKINIRWETESRSDIKKQITSISKDITVTLSEEQMVLLGRPSYMVTYPDGTTAMMTPQEYHESVYPLTAEQQESMNWDEPEMHLDVMGPISMETLGITIESLRSCLFSSLTDDDLTILGIPEQGDVMYYNDKPVFRYYIAILEEYFALSKREISLM